MHVAEFITVDEDKTDLTLSFAIVPSAERSLVLQRSPRHEVLLPVEERGISISMWPDDGGPDRNLLVSVLWTQTQVEFRSQLRTYVIDVSKIDEREIWWAKKALRKMARGGVADVRGA
jgi:hypothetical protein